MSFENLLIHKANVYEFNINPSDVDDYNMPIVSLLATEYANISCRLQHYHHKSSGLVQQEVELIEEKPALLFVSGTSFTPTHSNYVFHFSIDSSNFYIVQEMKVLYAQSIIPHHYELLVVPFNEEISGDYTAPV